MLVEVLRKCGDNLHALGWQVAGPECEPPDPASVIHPGSGLTYQLEQKDKQMTRLYNLQRELAGRPFPGHPASSTAAARAPNRPAPALPAPR